MKVRSIQHVAEQRGIVLILSLLVMTVLFILALAFLATAQTEHNIATNYRDYTAAFYFAEAGLEKALNQLNVSANPAPIPASPRRPSGQAPLTQ